MKPKRKVQDTILGNYLFELVVPRDHPLRLFRHLIDWNLIQRMLPKKDYSPIGRCATDPLILTKLLVLEFLEALSDVKVVLRSQTDLALRYFLDLPVPYSIPDDTTLVKFRAWLGVEGVQLVFDEILHQIHAAGYAQGDEIAVLDSTAQRANIQPLSARALIHRVLEKIFTQIEAWEALFPDSHFGSPFHAILLRHSLWKIAFKQKLAEGVLTKKERFLQTVWHARECIKELTQLMERLKGNNSALATQTPFITLTDSLAFLEQIIRETILEASPDSPSPSNADSESEAESASDLTSPSEANPPAPSGPQADPEAFPPSEDNSKNAPTCSNSREQKAEPPSASSSLFAPPSWVKSRSQKRKGRKILSQVDPEARGGHKSDREKFIGYKLHVLMTADQIITAIITSPGNIHDQTAMLALVHAHYSQIGVYPTTVGADKAYGSGFLRHELHEWGIQEAVLLKTPQRSAFFPAASFLYAPEKEALTCPAGRVSTKWSFAGDRQTRVFRFGRDCWRGCPFQPQCTKARNGRTVSISTYWKEMEDAKTFNASEAFVPPSRARWGLEGKFGQGKRSHGMGRARYWGLAKTHLQNLLIGIALNLKRLLTLMNSRKALSSAVPA